MGGGRGDTAVERDLSVAPAGSFLVGVAACPIPARSIRYAPVLGTMRLRGERAGGPFYNAAAFVR